MSIAAQSEFVKQLWWAWDCESMLGVWKLCPQWGQGQCSGVGIKPEAQNYFALGRQISLTGTSISLWLNEIGKNLYICTRTMSGSWQTCRTRARL